MLLTFIGQVSASTAFSACQMNTQSQDLQHNMQEMDHSSHMTNMRMAGMQASDSDLVSNMDCCQNEFNCSMSGCLSVALNSIYEGSTPSISVTPIVLEFTESIIQIPNSLYRPPILS